MRLFFSSLYNTRRNELKVAVNQTKQFAGAGGGGGLLAVDLLLKLSPEKKEIINNQTVIKQIPQANIFLFLLRNF